MHDQLIDLLLTGTTDTLIMVGVSAWTAPSILDTRRPHFEAASKASGLIPSRCE